MAFAALAGVKFIWDSVSAALIRLGIGAPVVKLVDLGIAPVEDIVEVV